MVMEGCILSLYIICTVVRVFSSAIVNQDVFRFNSRVIEKVTVTITCAKDTYVTE